MLFCIATIRLCSVKARTAAKRVFEIGYGSNLGIWALFLLLADRKSSRNCCSSFATVVSISTSRVW